MDPKILEPNCDQCAALCCFALAFDEGEAFPIDKPNGVVCPKLGEGNRCTVYEERDSIGFKGCMQFNCAGAGQRVTQEVFGGRSWRDEAPLLVEMTEAFVLMRRVHEQLSLLIAATKLDLNDDETFQIQSYFDELSPTGGWTEELLDQFIESDVEKRIKSFLQSLRHHVA